MKRNSVEDEAEGWLDVLHGLIAVAELKLPAFLVEALEVGVLHGLIAVAELKLARRAASAGKPAEFSTASSPWPN